MSSAYGKLATIRDYWMPRDQSARAEVRITDLDEVLRAHVASVTLAADRLAEIERLRAELAREHADHRQTVDDAAPRAVDLRAAYQQACDLVNWTGAADTVLADPEGLRAAAVRLRDLLGAATHAAPLPRQPLSEEKIHEIFHAARNEKLGANQDNSKHRLSVVEIARAIERAHGIGGDE